MVVYRAILALATTLCGGVILARLLAYGLRIETLPGIVLGGAMIGLGVHRISLIVRALGRGTT